jgi:hypothetical protein
MDKDKIIDILLIMVVIVFFFGMIAVLFLGAIEESNFCKEHNMKISNNHEYCIDSNDNAHKIVRVNSNFRLTKEVVTLSP